MDTISKAIIDSIKREAQDDVAEAYQNLKQLLQQQYGDQTDLVDAIEMLEKKPDSNGRQTLLKEEIKAAQLERDPEVRAAAETLQQLLKPRPKQRPRRWKRPIPIQQPPLTDPFIGRGAALTAVLDDLQIGRVVGISGVGGIGKSALAAEVVQKLIPTGGPPEQFPGGVVHHNFYTQPRVDIALEEIVRSYGGEPIPSPYEAVEKMLVDRKALLILDGIERADDLPGILSMTGQCAVLATGRHCPTEFITDPHRLDPLSPEEAMLLLHHWTGFSDEVPARRICDLLGGLPLAIRLAGQFVAAQRVELNDLLTWLKSTRMAELDATQRQEAAVSLLIEHNISHVSKIAQEALAIIGLLAPIGFAADVIAKTVVVPDQPGIFATIRGFFRHTEARHQRPQALTILQELSAVGILYPVGDRYQISHNLIYEYIRKHQNPSTKTIRQLASYFIGLAWEQDVQATDGVPRLEEDRPHFMTVMSECIRWKEWNAAHGLAVAIEDYLDRHGHLADRVKANEIGLMAAWQLGRPNQGAWLGNLGDTYRTMGHAKWAIEHFNKALEAARQNGDRHSEGNSLGNLGLAYRDLGQIDQAIAYLKKAKGIFEDLHSPSASLVRDWLAELEEFEE